MTTVIEKVEELRKRKGVTKTHIAKSCGKSLSWYHKVSTGDRKLTVKSLELIAQALGEDVRIFFEQIVDETETIEKTGIV